MVIGEHPKYTTRLLGIIETILEIGISITSKKKDKRMIYPKKKKNDPWAISLGDACGSGGRCLKWTVEEILNKPSWQQLLKIMILIKSKY